MLKSKLSAKQKELIKTEVRQAVKFNPENLGYVLYDTTIESLADIKNFETLEADANRFADDYFNELLN